MITHNRVISTSNKKEEKYTPIALAIRYSYLLMGLERIIYILFVSISLDIPTDIENIAKINRERWVVAIKKSERTFFSSCTAIIEIIKEKYKSIITKKKTIYENFDPVDSLANSIAIFLMLLIFIRNRIYKNLLKVIIKPLRLFNCFSYSAFMYYYNSIAYLFNFRYAVR